MATRFLNERLQKIQKIKSSDPRVEDPTPTLVDIEKTHILFVNAHFKPYVAIGYEYQTVSQSKSNLGGQLIFSIPLYGDFIHDMMLYIKLGAVSASNTGTGNTLIRYVDYPGERICKSTEFSVNGNVLDTYENDVMPFHREFCVQPNKKVGYNRMMGQQEELKGTLNANGLRGTASESTVITKGAQTPKATQDALELWVPILFWFSRDVRLSLISVAIPHGQRYLKIQLAEAGDLLQHFGSSSSNDNPGNNPVPTPDIEFCELYVNNIFVNPEIHSIIINRIGFSLIRVHRIQRYNADKSSDEILLSQLKWPIEIIYAGARPQTNISKGNINMCNDWHKFSVQSRSVLNSGKMSTNAYTWGAFANDPAQAADYTTALTRIDAKATGVNFATDLGVGAATVLTVAQVNTVLAKHSYKTLSGAFVNVNAPLNAEIVAATPNGSAPVEFSECASAFDKLGIKAHGIELFKSFNTRFYNAYLPWQYGADKIQTPEDCGKLMIPFNLYPGTYQPSGHVNISRAREFYINYTSSFINSNNVCDVLFIGVTINFLLISDKLLSVFAIKCGQVLLQ